MHLLFAVCLMLLTCCANVYILQMILLDAPQSPNLVSFMQVFFVALEGFIFTSKFFTEKSHIPICDHGKVAAINFINISCQSILIYTRVDIAIQHLSRASTLIGTLCLGTLVYKKQYRASKYVSVALITLGITVVFISSADSMHRIRGKSGEFYTGESTWFQFITTIIVIILSIYSSSLLGIQQEIIFNKYGKYPMEALFYCHALLLPTYTLLIEDIVNQISVFNGSELVPVFGSDFVIPKLWLLLVGNVVTQYICSRTIYNMTAEFTSLTVSLMITLRKFSSLVISLVHFDNNFTGYHWIGTFLIFSGTILFIDEIYDRTQAFFQHIHESASRLRPGRSVE